MFLVKKEQAQEYSGDGYSGRDYPMTDPDINFATIKISCRSPKTGYQVNVECKELLYIMNGSGTLYMKDSEDTIEFKQGDVIFIDMNVSMEILKQQFLVPLLCIQNNTNIQIINIKKPNDFIKFVWLFLILIIG